MINILGDKGNSAKVYLGSRHLNMNHFNEQVGLLMGNMGLNKTCLLYTSDAADE